MNHVCDVFRGVFRLLVSFALAWFLDMGSITSWATLPGSHFSSFFFFFTVTLSIHMLCLFFLFGEILGESKICMHMRSSPFENIRACSESFYYETKIFANGTLEEDKQKPKEAVKIDQNAVALINKGAKLSESSAVASMPVGEIFRKYLCL